MLFNWFILYFYKNFGNFNYSVNLRRMKDLIYPIMNVLNVQPILNLAIINVSAQNQIKFLIQLQANAFSAKKMSTKMKIHKNVRKNVMKGKDLLMENVKAVHHFKVSTTKLMNVVPVLMMKEFSQQSIFAVNAQKIQYMTTKQDNAIVFQILVLTKMQDNVSAVKL